MAYGYSLVQPMPPQPWPVTAAPPGGPATGFQLAPGGVPMVSPWPAMPPPAPAANQPPMPSPSAGPQAQPAAAPGGVPLFPRLAERFPGLETARQNASGFGDKLDARFPRLGEFRHNNSNALTAMGIALMTADSPDDVGPAMREAFYFGRQADMSEAERRRAEEEQQRQADALRQGVAAMSGGSLYGGGGATGASYRDPIAAVESGGRYDALGPVIPSSGDRAYGKYQVMGANVGPWTEQVLGRRMTPEEFLADSAAQDAVFDAIFGGYVERYGPEGAARAWFTGSPTGTGSDGYIDADEYVRRFAAGGGMNVGGGPRAGAEPTLTPQQAAAVLMAVESGDFQLARQLMAQAAFAQPERQNLMEVGGQVYDPNNNTWITPPGGGAENQNMRAQTRNMLNPADGEVHVYGYNPETNRYDVDMGIAPADAPVVAINGEQIPTPLLNNAIEQVDAATGLRQQVQELSVMRDLAQTTPTGWFESMTLGVRRALVSIGVIADENLPAQQVLVALQNQQALRLRNPDSGFGLTGNTSQRDVRFLLDSVANLGNTPEANLAILTILMAKQRRAAELAEMRADYIFNTGSLAGWADRQNAYIEENSMFTPEEAAFLTELGQRATTAQPAGETPAGQGAAPPAGVPQDWVQDPNDPRIFRNPRNPNEWVIL